MSYYKVFASDDVKQVDDTAYVQSEVVINGGTAKAISTLSNESTDPLTSRLGWGNVNRVFGSTVVQHNDVFGAFHTSASTITSVADNGSGKCEFTLNAHGLSVGDVLSISGASADSLNTVHVITATTANTFDTNVDFVTSATAGDYTEVTRNFATQASENYMIRRVNSITIAGTADNVLRSGASDFGGRRSIHKTEHGRTIKTKTAIRNGNWNIVTGTFSTLPSIADDSIGDVSGSTVTDGTADHAANVSRSSPGEFIYKEPQPNPVQDDYEAKTG